jgi:hypothetical protein
MSFTAGVKIDGTQETIRLLKKFYPDLAKEFTKEVKHIVAPITDAAKSKYPDKILSGMFRNWSQGKNSRPLFPYSASKARSGIKVKIRNKNSQDMPTAVITITQMNPAAAIVDMAGKTNAGTGIMFNQNLTSAFGNPSRVMWPSTVDHIAQINNNISDLVHKQEKIVSSQLAKVG